MHIELYSDHGQHHDFQDPNHNICNQERHKEKQAEQSKDYFLNKRNR